MWSAHRALADFGFLDPNYHYRSVVTPIPHDAELVSIPNTDRYIYIYLCVCVCVYYITYSMAQQPFKSFDYPLMRVSLSNFSYTYFILKAE